MGDRAGSGTRGVSVSTTGADEPLAVWAFEAAMEGLPESEARDLVEGDRYPEPDASEWEESVRSVDIRDGRVVLYDPDEERAWIQSDTTRDLRTAR